MENKRFGELQLPKNLRLGHCAVTLPAKQKAAGSPRRYIVLFVSFHARPKANLPILFNIHSLHINLINILCELHKQKWNLFPLRKMPANMLHMKFISGCICIEYCTIGFVNEKTCGFYNLRSCRFFY